MTDIEPVTGWSLSYIVELDTHRSGTAGAFLRASAERRQVIAAFLASKPLPSCAREAAALAEFISTATHRDILSEAFPTVPYGLRGALARSGPQPHPPSFYRLLYRLLTSPTDTAGVINQLEELNPRRLMIAQRLPFDIRLPNVVQLIANPRQAADVVKLVDLFSSNGIDRASLAEALRRVSTRKQMMHLWDRWSQKLLFPPHPVPPSQHYTPISSGAELRRIALKYRNCARHYLVEVMETDAAFAEFGCAGGEAVVHLKRRKHNWTLNGLFGKRNEAVPPVVRTPVTNYLQEHGVQTSNAEDAESEWAVLGRLSGRHMFVDF